MQVTSKKHSTQKDPFLGEIHVISYQHFPQTSLGRVASDQLEKWWSWRLPQVSASPTAVPAGQIDHSQL